MPVNAHRRPMGLALMQRLAPLALSMIVLGSGLGCMTRTVTDQIYDHKRVEAFLRYKVRFGKPVDRHFDHPASISEERLARILSTIHIRTEADGPQDQRTAIPSDLIYPLARALSVALAQADSSQEVALIGIRKETHLGVFARKRLTSLTSFVREGDLYLLLSRVEWDMDEARKKRNDKVKVPMPTPDEVVMEFRTIPNIALGSAGKQGVITNWRDPYWARMGTVQRQGDQIKRRTILMESEDMPQAPSAPNASPDLPTDPKVLRELADLEDQRRKGEISETEYQRRRRKLLE